MAKVHNGEENRRKFQRTNVTDDRQTTDGFAIARSDPNVT